MLWENLVSRATEYDRFAAAFAKLVDAMQAPGGALQDLRIVWGDREPEFAAFRFLGVRGRLCLVLIEQRPDEWVGAVAVEVADRAGQYGAPEYGIPFDPAGNFYVAEYGRDALTVDRPSALQRLGVLLFGPLRDVAVKRPAKGEVPPRPVVK